MKEVLVENRLIKTKELRANKGQLVDKGIPTNPRKITKEKYNLLLQSLEKSNLTQIRPLDVIEHDGKFIVLSGNQRLRALKELKIKEVPCNILRDDLEPETYRQIVLQANTNYGEHDDDLLANEWDAVELHEWGYDLPCWEEEKIEQETQGDDDVPVSAPDITVKGDLYTLGEHRLLCGDSTMIDDVEKLMDGAKADMVFTDPPYGCDLDKTLLVQSSKKYNAIQNDGGKNIQGFLNAVSESFYVSCKEWASGYWFYSSNKVIETRQAIESFFDIKDTIIWKKESLVPGRNDYQPIYEPLFYFQLKGAGNVQRVWNGNRNQVNLWEFNRDKSLGKHPTQKPIDLIANSINNSSNPEAKVLDLFLGSGSTLIACEKTNRKCYGMELDQKYCDVIVKRYIEFCVKNNKEAKVYRNGDLISNDVFLVESEGKS